MKTNKNSKLLVAGGGTGGHVLAGVAIADAWKKHFGENTPVLFVGAQGGLEEKLVPKSGYPLRLLKIGSLNRVSLKRKIKTAIQLPLSFCYSIWILVQFRPSAVIGVGGYASGPLIFMAWFLSATRLLKIKTGIIEQNSVPGLTNRILGRFVDFIFAAFPGTEKRFHGREVIVTGNPIRSTMKLLPSASRRPFTIFVFGGSQGALGVNSLVLDSLKHLIDLKNQIRFIHQTGEKDYQRVLDGYCQLGYDSRVEKFIFDMLGTYAESSLLICRAGSSTLAEIAAVGRASVLIPLPTAADNHQEVNAQIFVKEGAAFLMSQKSSKGEDLAKLIRELVQNADRIQSVESNVTQFYKPNAASDVVKRLI